MKQVIVIRRDLQMRQGKAIAQGSHASMATLIPVLMGQRKLSKKEKAWLEDGQAKIAVKVDSLEELLDLQKKARELGIEAHTITDRGYTEFKGEPTVTSLAIGPDTVERVNEVTAHLKLL